MFVYIIVAFVSYATAGTEFFTSSTYYSEFSQCDHAAHLWSQEKAADPEVRELWAECAKMPKQTEENTVSGDA